jgi:hypothetical protein
VRRDLKSSALEWSDDGVEELPILSAMARKGGSFDLISSLTLLPHSKLEKFVTFTYPHSPRCTYNLLTHTRVNFCSNEAL